MGTSKLGTPSYTAPEVLLGQDYCHEVRVVSMVAFVYVKPIISSKYFLRQIFSLSGVFYTR